MRAVLICAFAVLAVVCVQSVVDGLPTGNGNPLGHKICEPGSSKALDCNTCFCNADGTLWGCTLMGCPEHNGQYRPKRESDIPEKRPKICEPGSTKALECNSCFCIADGTAWGCTLKGCL